MATKLTSNDPPPQVLQVQTKTAQPSLLPTPYGYRLHQQEDGVFHWFYERLVTMQWEPFSFAIIDTCLQPDSYFIDIGTWIAPLALYALTKPGTAVLGVEPDPVARERCFINMAANEDTLQCSERMIVEPVCISNDDDAVQFGNVDHGLGDSMSKMGVGELTVPAMTFSQLLAKYQVSLDRISLIKMDIEGGEEKAFDNLLATLAAHAATAHQLPALYLSYHVPNFQHPTDTCTRIANGLHNLYQHVTAVETNEPLQSQDDILAFMQAHEFGSVLCQGVCTGNALN
eukprot:m.37765 g.37765  ORF g.37765 m.37765 type:complete len:286 (+) comp12545_c0_seq3:95-952(+)